MWNPAQTLCNFPHPLRRQFFRGYALLEEAIFTDGRIFSYYMGKIWLKSWWKISSNWVWGSQVMKFEQIWTNAIEWHGEAEIKKKNHIFLLSPEIHWSLKPLGSSYCLPTFSCRSMGRQYSLCQLYLLKIVSYLKNNDFLCTPQDDTKMPGDTKHYAISVCSECL